MKLQCIYFSLLILTLVLFLLPIVAVADPPAEAVKFVILKLSDSTVGTPVTVTVEAQKSNNKVDDSYQNDITLVASGSTTGAGLVDIVNGVGMIEINDNVAETVTLSLFDTEATGLDASSTREVDFAPVTDTTTPSAVSDLAASNPTTSSITLTWTAPGDDGNTGTAARYDVRYRINTMNSGTWNSATQTTGEPSPQIAGTAESMIVSGLTAGTIYYFAIKTSDEVLNESSLSNVVSLATITIPPSPTPSADLSITKSDSPDPVIAGDTLTYIITVTNNGPDDAVNVVVSDTLPLALTSPSLTSSQGTCTVFPCNFGIIASNHSASITITSLIDPGITGTITNIASISSDMDDPVTLNNVSTQDTAVSSPPPPSPVPSGGGGGSGGGGRPITVTFSGRAFPNAKIFIVDKDVRFETTVNQNIVADEKGTFLVNFVGISQGLHSFGLLIKDKDNRATQTKFFNINTLVNDLVVKDILVPPTTELLQRLVSRGQPALVTGNASPNNNIIIEIDDIIKKEANVEKDGSYKVAVDTGILEFGTHRIRVKQVDISQKRESDYSPTNAFVVSRLILPKTDLSGDGVVNIKDWSMFLSSWGSKNESQKKIIDFNGDGKINISDFSIFIRAIKK